MNNNGNKRRGCGCMKMARGYWNNFPYYTGPCPNEDGCYRWHRDDDDGDNDDRRCRRKRRHDRYDDCERPGRPDWCDDNDGDNDDDDDCQRPGHKRRRRRCRGDGLCGGIFTAWLPVAISANGIVPLTVNNPCRKSSFEVNSGLITVENEGTYLATYTVQVPAATALDTNITLNVDGASQSAAATQVTTAAGDTTASYTGQAIFEAAEGATVSLRTSAAINVTEPAAQPIFTLSLVQLEE